MQDTDPKLPQITRLDYIDADTQREQLAANGERVSVDEVQQRHEEKQLVAALHPSKAAEFEREEEELSRKRAELQQRKHQELVAPVVADKRNVERLEECKKRRTDAELFASGISTGEAHRAHILTMLREGDHRIRNSGDLFNLFAAMASAEVAEREWPTIRAALAADVEAARETVRTHREKHGISDAPKTEPAPAEPYEVKRYNWQDEH
jgi:hypothetical protein